MNDNEQQLWHMLHGIVKMHLRFYCNRAYTLALVGSPPATSVLRLLSNFECHKNKLRRECNTVVEWVFDHIAASRDQERYLSDWFTDLKLNGMSLAECCRVATEVICDRSEQEVMQWCKRQAAWQSKKEEEAFAAIKMLNMFASNNMLWKSNEDCAYMQFYSLIATVS